MDFTIVTLKNINGTLDENLEKIFQVMKRIVPIVGIDYSTFRQSTKSKPVSLYIMDKRNDKEITNVKTMKDTFKPKFNVGKFRVETSRDFDPRFMIIDIHDVSRLNFKYKYAFRIMMSEKIPVSRYVLTSNILDSISSVLNTECMLFHVGKELNDSIEAVEKVVGTKRTLHAITEKDSGIIAKITKQEEISINKILAAMDENIEILMAPTDIVDYENSLRNYNSSLKYIQSLNKQENFKSAEEDRLRKDIQEIKAALDVKSKMIGKEPNIRSKYIRVYDPSKLEKFRIRKVNFDKMHKNNTRITI